MQPIVWSTEGERIITVTGNTTFGVRPAVECSFQNRIFRMDNPVYELDPHSSLSIEVGIQSENLNLLVDIHPKLDSSSWRPLSIVSYAGNRDGLCGLSNSPFREDIEVVNRLYWKSDRRHMTCHFL